jgi:hypothetical protein
MVGHPSGVLPRAMLWQRTDHVGEAHSPFRRCAT